MTTDSHQTYQPKFLDKRPRDLAHRPV